MASRRNISVSFTEQQAEFLAECVNSGQYQSASEVVRDGIRLLQSYQERLQAELDKARFLVREGSRQADSGEVIDGEAFMAEWEAELDQARRDTGLDH